MLHRISKRILLSIAIVSAVCIHAMAQAPTDKPIRVVIVGLVHDHARGFIGPLSKNTNVQLVGISEPDTALAAHYESQFHLDHKLFYTDMDKMLDQLHPDAVLVYTDIADHRKVIEDAAKRGINSMVEKPLATTMADAIAIRATAREHHVQVLVNYETTWYSSNAEAIRESDAGKLGPIRRVVVHDGHEGPKEIGVSPTFLNWLADPEKNGAGAMFDFGCYGADLMTVLMHGETPLSVTAVAQTDKPDIYPHVDDDATIIIRYPHAQAVLMPSWNWTFSRKDMEVYGTKAYAIAVNPTQVKTRTSEHGAEEETTATPLVPPEDTSLHYLAAVVRKQLDPKDDLTGLATNMTVVQILDAARHSTAEGKTIMLHPLPN